MLPLLLLLAGCHPQNACEAYVGALTTCATARGASPTLYDPEAVCVDWDDAHDDHYGEYYACREAAYAGADCSSDDGYAEALAAEACCAPPGATPDEDACPDGS